MTENGNIYELLPPGLAGYEGTLTTLKKQSVKRLLATVDDERKVFLGGWVSGMRTVSRERDALHKALLAGMKPSAYAEKSLTWVRDKGFVPSGYWHELLEAMDRVLEQPYSTGWERRSYRSLNWGAYIERVHAMLRDFVNDVLLPFKLVDLLTGHVPETVTEFMSKTSFCPTTALVARIAAALDRNDTQVEAAIRDMIDGDAKPFFMSEVVRGILWSHRSDMHEMLGRLLVAARLQEGLRQTICENADMGSPEAFMAMINVIEQNDLIRFSSVKRAVGVWLGLISQESGSLDRVSSKSIALISRCLKDEAFIEECLSSEDSMQIHIGLWAIGVRDVRKATERAGILAAKGTHHQRLSAGYFVLGLQLPLYQAVVAMNIIAAYPDELDTVAMYLPMMMEHCLIRLGQTVKSEGDATWREYFGSEQEARNVHALLVSIRSQFTKKQVFEPCVFPWHKAVLEKGDLSERICVIARLLKDDQLIDDSIQYFADCDPWNRESLLQYSYGRMRTPKQRQMILTSVCDKGDMCRRTAIKLVDAMNLTAEDYAELEKLLRFKYADSRTALIRWMMKQSDDALFDSLTRLLGDKKSEERRMAALDIVKQLADEDKRAALISRCAQLVSAYENPTAKEKTLVDSLLEKFGAASAEEDTLFTEEDVYHPVIADTPESEQAVLTYMRYFPESQLADQLGGRKKRWADLFFKKNRDAFARARADFNSLLDCYEQHKMDPVKTGSGEETLLSNLHGLQLGQKQVVLYEVWDAWYQEQVNDPERLLRLCVLAHSDRSSSSDKAIVSAFGEGYQQGVLPLKDSRRAHLQDITADLVKQHVPASDLKYIAAALLIWLAQCVGDSLLWAEPTGEMARWMATQHITNQDQLSLLLEGLDYGHEGLLPVLFPAGIMLYNRSEQAFKKYIKTEDNGSVIYQGLMRVAQQSFAGAIMSMMRKNVFPDLPVVLGASYKGLLSRRGVYAWLLTSKMARNAIRDLTALADVHRASGQQFTTRTTYGFYINARHSEECLREYLGKNKPETDEDFAMLQYADEVCTPLVRRIIDAELKRGDTETPYSPLVGGIQRIWGAEDFMAILSGLGKDKLLRSYYFGAQGHGRTESLCTMLGVCVPAKTDTADDLRRLMKQHKISEKRLIEAALYSPEWIELVGETIGLPGFRSAAYYFMAHMNEDFDDVRKARIARFTPLSIEELQNGAFDIGWFRSAHEEVGEKYFDLIYDAAKYITSGAKHARARKYADAVRGRLELAATKDEIIQKRNKDLLMAYALIPLSGEDDLQSRYLYIQQFLKESRGFGAQRAASEKTASEIALTNLALNAGYADSMRLTLRMETRLVEENHELFEPHVIDDLTVQLNVDDQGAASLLCMKGGKALKSIPAKYKKNEYIQRLNDMKKQLVEQQRRAKRMLEDAMEASTMFTAGEIAALMGNPVIAPMLRHLVFMQEERFGFIDGLTITDADGVETTLKVEDELIVAHPFHLWKAQQWLPFQRKIYAEHMVQPFRQVFRELYVKTPDELGKDTSLRYAGNQIQPARTMACLKTRRWIADAEAGLQKIYYKENIVATIWALADWFSPADIEAPTLEWVAFLDRKNGKQLKIDDVPEIIFSEVMRDVDLAVSVAHAGGVDPETSHSTMEMRAAILSFTLLLFRLNNVEIRDRHAIIAGELAQYSVHLGSGVVHQIGGTMLSVLPVHSQHRGKLFLPFVDEDPKTAEIISKVLLFAEDGKLKDPTILEQIRR